MTTNYLSYSSLVNIILDILFMLTLFRFLNLSWNFNLVIIITKKILNSVT
jgi:hypothetical protein